MIGVPAYWFDKDVTILRKSQTQDTGGGVIESYTAIGNFRMRLNALGGSEINTGGGSRTSNQYTFYAPGDTDIISTDIISYASRRFDVINVSDLDEQGIFLNITAVEVVVPP